MVEGKSPTWKIPSAPREASLNLVADEGVVAGLGGGELDETTLSGCEVECLRSTLVRPRPE
jgi:hypothetical protein